MPLVLNRRQILKFLGGSITGILFTPIPWKLLDDTAIWTQTGPWIAKLPRGNVSFSFTNCPVCPVGCGIKARCVSGIPVGLSPLGGHPLGGLCPIGIGAHQLRYHPLRITAPVRISKEKCKVEELSIDEATALLRDALPSRGSVGLLDLRPGRTVSLQYRVLMGSMPGGEYLISPSDDHVLFHTLEKAFDAPEGSFAVDLVNASTILSFGVPLVEMWEGGKAFTSLKGRRQKIIQVEARRSRTAALANRWIPIRPGSEGAFALSLASVLVDEKLYDQTAVSRVPDFAAPRGSSFMDLIREFRPAQMESITGITRESIVGIARELAANPPAVVISSADAGGGGRTEAEERALWGLNVLLGSVNRSGGIGLHREVPRPSRYVSSQLAEQTSFSAISDHSLDVLIIDQSQPVSTMPWELVHRKLSSSGTIFCFSPTLSGLAAMSDIVIPVPAPLENITDLCSSPGCAAATYAVSSPLGASTHFSEPVALLSSILGSPVTSEELIRERAATIHAEHRGKVFSPKDGSWKKLEDVAEAGEFWETMRQGGAWTDDGTRELRVGTFRFMGTQPEVFKATARAWKTATATGSLTVLFSGRRNAIDHAQLSPVMTKVCQESGLWQTAQVAMVHPGDAKSAGLDDGEQAVLTTPHGALEVIIHVDPSVIPGFIEVAVGPAPIAVKGSALTITEGPLSLADIDRNGQWRTTSVTLRKGALS